MAAVRHPGIAHVRLEVLDEMQAGPHAMTGTARSWSFRLALTPFALALACVVALSCAPPVSVVLPPSPLPVPVLGAEDEAWIARTLDALSLEARIGQMMMVRASGEFRSTQDPDRRALEWLVSIQGVGGLLVDGDSPPELALMLNGMQRAAVLPLLVGMDPEPPASSAGVVSIAVRVGGTRFPPSMGIAATGDPVLAELAGRVLGREARAMGVHVLFGPPTTVAAVSGPLDVRTYGTDAKQVADLAGAYVRGVVSAHAIAAARTFESAPPRPSSAPEANDNLVAAHWLRELSVIRTVIDAGASGLRIGHASGGTVGGTDVPTSLAPSAVPLLRERLEFDGLTFTAPLDAPALSAAAGRGQGELAIAAVRAGADVLVAPADPVQVHRSLVSAVRSGRIHYTRIDSSVVRILRAKALLELHEHRTVALDSLSSRVGGTEHTSVARDMAARSLTLVVDSPRVLPLDPTRIRSVGVVSWRSEGDVQAGRVLEEELERLYGRNVQHVALDASTDPLAFDRASALAGRVDAVILALFASPDPDGRAAALAASLAAVAPRYAVVSFTEPVQPATLPGTTTLLVAWYGHPDAQIAVARTLAGDAPLSGRLPAPLGVHPIGASVYRRPVADELRLVRPAAVGMDAAVLDRLDDEIESALIAGAAPGAALAIGRHGQLVRSRGYGTLDRRRGYAHATDSSLYDLASLTKAVATTTAIMMLVDSALVDLEAPLGRYLQEWEHAEPKRRITVRHLLEHSSGLPAYLPLWRESLRGAAAYRDRIATLALEFEPGTGTLYSDFNAMLLGFLVEQVTGQSLEAFLRTRLFAPLRLRETGFNPLAWPTGMLELDGEQSASASGSLLGRIAPTEIDTVFRMRHVHGEVQDENAHALGGVAGHAGLFSSARDLAVIAQLLLNGGFYGGTRLIDPATVALFTRPREPGGKRTLGWEVSAPGSSTGSFFSARAYGHTGFTGTSVWIDPEQDLFVILLTNRVNPSRGNQRHVQLRAQVAAAVQRAILR